MIPSTNRLETDVCVAHSALGLAEQGYKVVVVHDATASPGTAHEYGITRMQNAGIVVVSVKGLYFEWVRTVALDNAFRTKMMGALVPPVDL
jgi:nicotinamidase-related amidase